MSPTDPLVAEGTALAGALAPLGGPYAVLADQLLTSGLQYLLTIQQAKAAGTITREMLQPLADLVGADLAQLQADFAQQQLGAKLGFQPVAAGQAMAAGVANRIAATGPPVSK